MLLHLPQTASSSLASFHRRALLASNDSALLAAHPPKPKDYQGSEQTSVDLERAYELVCCRRASYKRETDATAPFPPSRLQVQANASFTGLELSEAESRLVTVENSTLPLLSITLGTLLTFRAARSQTISVDNTPSSVLFHLQMYR